MTTQQQVKTLRFTRDELELLLKGMDLWFESGESTPEEYERLCKLLDRLRTALAAETPEERAERERKNNELADLSRRWARS